MKALGMVDKGSDTGGHATVVVVAAEGRILERLSDDVRKVVEEHVDERLCLTVARIRIRACFSGTDDMDGGALVGARFAGMEVAAGCRRCRRGGDRSGGQDDRRGYCEPHGWAICRSPGVSLFLLLFRLIVAPAWRRDERRDEGIDW